MKSVGKIEIIHGCMFAGKTSELIKKFNYYSMLGKQILVLSNKKDIRTDINKLCTHNKDTISCISLDTFKGVHDSKEFIDSDIVIIEEAQFFGKEIIDFVITSCESFNKHIIAAGLLLDCHRKKFGYLLDLIPLADEVHHLKAICTECNKLGIERKAIFTKRILDSDEQTLVGGADKYIAVCRCHFNIVDEIQVKNVIKKTNIESADLNYNKYFLWGGGWG